MRQIQFRLWHLVLIVAIAALSVAVLMRLFPPEPPSTSPTMLVTGWTISVNFAGYEIPHTSPIFWIITAAILAAVLGILATLILAVSWVAWALTKARRRGP